MATRRDTWLAFIESGMERLEALILYSHVSPWHMKGLTGLVHLCG